MKTYAFLLKLRDKPGAMEVIAATFAHRGISLATILANDAATAPDSLATILVTFRTTRPRKDGVKAALARLTRVVSITEREEGDPTLQQSALVRLAPGAALPTDPQVQLTRLGVDAATGETLWALFGPLLAVEVSVEALRASGSLSALSIATVAL
jgi:acetolactate synthase small subunit